MEIKTGAAYVRVSTDGQLDLSLDAQKREILKYAKVNGIIIPEEFIFTEKVGISGKKANCRPEFQRMIATARQKPAPFEAVLVWKFSPFRPEPGRKYLLQVHAAEEVRCRCDQRHGADHGGNVWPPDRDDYRVVG